MSNSMDPPRLGHLLDQITINLRMSRFDNKKFLPQDCFDRIFSDHNIDAALGGISQDLLTFIKKKAKKVFATVVRANRGSGHQCVAIMKSFYEQSFHDEHLPLDDDPQCKRFPSSKCSHTSSLDSLHDENLWSLTSIQEFFDERWMFLVPVFSRTAFRHKISRNAILPFEWVEEDDSKNSFGGFSKVQQARMHLSHQTVLSTTEFVLNVAIKELLPSHLRPETAWELELRAIDGIRSDETNSHEHLTPTIGGFQRGNRFYLVFQWADGKSLKDFWEKNEKPSLSPDFIEATLRQLIGLADALKYMHRESSKTPTPSDGNLGHWRHGDIKPENILRFKCTDAEMNLGTLRIADLGLSVPHTMVTEDRKAVTTTRFGTMKYEGPEAHPSVTNLRARSRRYDVWSMGCVILEFIIWMLFGYEGWKEFDNEPYDKDVETHFYKVTSESNVEVNGIAKRCMKAMKKNPEMAYEGGPTALRDLLELVEKKLLVVAVRGNKKQSSETEKDPWIGKTEPGYRASADELKEGLEKILEKGKANRYYLYTGKDRTRYKYPRAKSINIAQSKSIGESPKWLHPGTPISPNFSRQSTTVVETRIPVPILDQSVKETFLTCFI